MGALDPFVHSFSSIPDSMEPFCRSITHEKYKISQTFVQYYERHGSYYTMLDIICVKKCVMLGIFHTILSQKQSIEPQN